MSSGPAEDRSKEKEGRHKSGNKCERECGQECGQPYFIQTLIHCLTQRSCNKVRSSADHMGGLSPSSLAREAFLTLAAAALAAAMAAFLWVLRLRAALASAAAAAPNASLARAASGLCSVEKSGIVRVTHYTVQKTVWKRLGIIGTCSSRQRMR